jgi:alanine-synthesizing transaminase
VTTFSKRVEHDPAFNTLAEALVRRQDAGKRILDLTESNPTRAGVPYDARAILDALGDVRAMRYDPEPFGLASAREALARDLEVSPAHVILTASTSEAYAFLFKLLCDPGDEVLVPAPSYPLFDQLATFESVVLKRYRLAYDGAWHVDVASLRDAITPRTRAILAVRPNIPTGSFLAKSELSAMRATGLPVICDEVFGSYGLRADTTGRRVTCAAKEHGSSLVFSLGGLSKLAGLPQMKLAWILVSDTKDTPEALRRLAWIADAYLSVATPVQVALPTILAVRKQAHAAIRARTRRNLEALTQRVHGSECNVLDVEGGWYATVRAPRLRTEMDSCLRALDRGVYVHPGAFFGFEDEGYYVVSLLTPEATFDEGVRLLLESIT